MPKWREIGNPLAHRPGWHFDVVNQGDALWGLDLLGESHLNASVTDGGLFHCYGHEADEDAEFVTTAEVERRLTEHDTEAKRGPSEMLLSMVSPDNWDVFKRHEFKLLVSWSDGGFAASLPYHYDASISPYSPRPSSAQPSCCASSSAHRSSLSRPRVSSTSPPARSARAATPVNQAR